jgi:hypothetical protein
VKLFTISHLPFNHLPFTVYRLPSIIWSAKISKNVIMEKLYNAKIKKWSMVNGQWSFFYYLCNRNKGLEVRG